MRTDDRPVTGHRLEDDGGTELSAGSTSPNDYLCRIRPMLRLATTAVLMLALVLQLVSAAVPTQVCHHAHDWDHAALHVQNVSHHHHDADSFHLDESSESIAHVLADHVSFSALLADARIAAPIREGGERHAHVFRAAPQPPPDGLLRPPRLTA